MEPLLGVTRLQPEGYISILLAGLQVPNTCENRILTPHYYIRAYGLSEDLCSHK